MLEVIWRACKVRWMMSGTFVSCLFNSNVEFPRIPSGIIKRHITDEANARLAFYLPMPEATPPIPDAPPRPQLAPGVVDTPLVRVYNFLRESIATFLFTESFLIQTSEMMSLSYQLEILWYQVRTILWCGVPFDFYVVLGRAHAIIGMGGLFISTNVPRPKNIESIILDVRYYHLPI